MEPYRRLILWSVGLIAVVATWYVALYRPHSRMSEQVRAQVNSLSKEVRAVTATAPKIEKLRKRLASLDTSISRIEAKIYAKRELPEILARMQDEGRRFGLRFKSIYPDYDILFARDSSSVSPSGVMRVPVHFIVEGAYVPFGRYLETFPEMPWRVVIGGVDLRLLKESYPRLMIDLLAYIYVYDEARDVHALPNELQVSTRSEPLRLAGDRNARNVNQAPRRRSESPAQGKG